MTIQGTASGPRRVNPCRIGIIRDRAFSFYYPENLDALRAEGGELVFIDTLADTRLPHLDGLYIGGGFPELYTSELEANRDLRMEIAHRVDDGMPVYAECAGLMYLCKSITWRGRTYEMVGTIPADVELVDRPQGHGYVEVEVTPENPLFDAGSVLRGHEFHHSRLIPRTDLTYGYRVRRGHGIDGTVDGVCCGNVFAAYTHLHALGVRSGRNGLWLLPRCRRLQVLVKWYQSEEDVCDRKKQFNKMPCMRRGGGQKKEELSFLL